MCQHPRDTGEYLAEEHLAIVNGDYAAAARSIRKLPSSVRRDHALAALAMWSTMAVIANDKDYD